MNKQTSYLPGRRIEPRTSRRFLQLTRVGLWLAALLLGAATATTHAASGTVVFSSSSGVSGENVTDGQGGSSDLASITLDFSVKGTNTTTSLPMTYEPDIYPGQNGISGGYADSIPQGTFFIKSSSTAVNFSFQSVFILDAGGSAGDTLKIEGFDDGISTGSILVTTAMSPWYYTFNTAALGGTNFQNVDEIRISESHGRDMFISLNNIQIGEPGAANATPTFVGATTNLSVYRSASATDVKNLLRVSDTDSSQTLTWSQSSAPAHGTLSFASATASSGNSDITPVGTITYTPTTAYTGADSFIVRVSDGTATNTRTIFVTVDAATASAGSGSPASVNNAQPTTALVWIIATQGIFPSASGGGAATDGYLGELRLVPYNGVVDNHGWVLCQGQLLPINQNMALFSLLGTAYGGDGTTTFALPDLRGRVPVGMGQGDGLTVRALGAKGGQESFILTTDNLPAHAHSYLGGATGFTGGGAGVDNMQPWLALNFCVLNSGPINMLGWVRIFAFNFTPSGHFAANGTILPITGNVALFSMLGTAYGGNGTTTFALPDLRGRTPIGAGTGGGLTERFLGEAGGSEQIFPLVTEIPAHVHAYSAGSTGITGGSQPHETVQPFLTLNVLLSAFGLYGTIGDEQPAVGEMRLFASDYLRDNEQGWFACDGALKPISENETLFNLIGTTFGGDGEETFALPNLSGRAVADAGQGTGLPYRNLGEQWGSETTAISLVQLPAHTHFFNAAPTDLALLTRSVSQSGGINATVGTLTATDADLGDLQTYSLVGGVGSTNNASFNLSGATLRANNAAVMLPGNYSVRVQTDDGNGGSYDEAFSITVVDDVSPTIASVAVPANATYRAGQNLDFTVRFTEVVPVMGTPTLSLTIGSATLSAAYLSGSGSSNLVFRYTVQAGDSDTNGLAATSPLALNGGTLRDASGNNVVLTFSVPTTTGVLVDAVAPQIISIVRKTPSQQTVATNTTVFTVTFSENVIGVIPARFAVTPVNPSTATGTVASVSGGPSIYDVTVNLTGGRGEFRLDVIAPLVP